MREMGASFIRFVAIRKTGNPSFPYNSTGIRTNHGLVSRAGGLIYLGNGVGSFIGGL